MATTKAKAKATETLPEGIVLGKEPTVVHRRGGGRKSIWLPLLESLKAHVGDWAQIREMPSKDAARRAVSHLRRAMKTRGTDAEAVGGPKVRIPDTGTYEFAWDEDGGKFFVYAQCVKKS